MTKNIDLINFEYLKLLLTKSFFKVISFTENKILFFFDNDKKQLICILWELKYNLEIKVLKNHTIFDSIGIDEDNSQGTCSIFQLNNNEIIIGCKKQNSYSKNTIQITKIIINDNNEFDVTINSIKFLENFDIKEFYDFQFLKDNDDNIIILLNYKDFSYESQNGFHSFGYSTCQNIRKKVTVEK